jgi:galactokinase
LIREIRFAGGSDGDLEISWHSEVKRLRGKTGLANLRELAQQFEARFGNAPRIFRAPGRVNLIGEHTDYNEGFVMPAAVEFSSLVAISPRPDRKLVIESNQFPGDLEFDVDRLPAQRTSTWRDYVLGVALVLRQHGSDLQGANLLVHGNVPIGSGLSSSASIEVASALAFISLDSKRFSLPEIAKLCRQAENEYVGARVGIMDQFVSCMGKAGHALLLDCRSLEFQFAHIPAGIELVVCNTMVKHDLATGAYNQRRAECEEGVRYFAKADPAIRALRDVSSEMLERIGGELPPTIRKRCTHVIRENQRTLDAARALAEGDLARMGSLMRESHESLRDLYQVSCRELDAMVDAAQGLPGFIGGRMTGGGFGGCTVNLVREENATDFAAQIAQRYRQATGINPQIYPCHAANGAQELILS